MAIDQDITNLPTPPSRSDSPSDFSDKADTFLAALPQLQTELNTYADEANSTQQVINTSESNAATSETNAEDWASKTDGIVLSTDFSAKAYALGGTGVTDVDGAAKEWAIKTGSTVDGSEYSSKDYAISVDTISDGSAKEWATNSGSTVDASEYSAKDYASSQNLISTGSSKDWAIKTGSTVDGTEFSAKKYADDAQSSADAAASSESNAASSETNAQDAASSAQSSANDAETALDNFTDQYLGAKSSEPSTDNDGDPLVTGALYYNTTEGQLYIWGGSDWEEAAFSTEGAVISFNGRDGAVTLQSSDVTTALGYTPEDESTAYDSSDFTTDFSNQTTDDLSEGSNNLYYTDNRARNAVSAAGDLNYDPATGTFSFTERTDAEVRNLFSASGNLTYDSATGVFTAVSPDAVLKPELVYPADNATDIREQPELDGGKYYSLYGKTHAISRFQVASDTGFTTIVYDSGEISGTTTHTVPSGNLSVSTTYYWRAYYEDEDGVESEFSDVFSFTTASEFFNPDIGDAVEGGFFAGYVVSDVDGQTYAIIVSDGDGDTDRTGAGTKEWRTSQTGLTEAQTLADGKSVMDHIVANETLSNFPVFEWIKTTLNDANYNGYSDWYLPARDELELIYRHFKPTTDSNNDNTRPSSGFGGDGATHGTNNSSDPNGSGYTTSDPSQTSITSFQNGGADYLTDDNYWSSTEYDAGRTWYQNFSNGFQGEITKDFTAFVRAVRRVQI